LKRITQSTDFMLSSFIFRNRRIIAGFHAWMFQELSGASIIVVKKGSVRASYCLYGYNGTGRLWNCYQEIVLLVAGIRNTNTREQLHLFQLQSANRASCTHDEIFNLRNIKALRGR
jgi:hypothetical protein